MHRVFLCLGLWLASIEAVPARDLYVQPDGDDKHDGTSRAHAVQTLQRAAELVMPGDIVNVGNGVYAPKNWTVVDFHHGGKAKQPIVFRAVNRYGATLGKDNATKYAVAFEPGVGHIRLQGFDIQEVGSIGILIGSSNAHIEIAENRLHAIGRRCTDTQDGLDGIFVEGSDVVIRNNEFFDIGRWVPGERGCTLSTTNFQNHDHGIYVAGANNLDIFGNRFGAMKGGWAIQVYHEKGGATSNLNIRDNVFEGGNPHREGQITFGPPGLDRGTIRGNRFLNSRGAPVNYAEGEIKQLEVRDNITVGNMPICEDRDVRRAKGIKLSNNRSVDSVEK